MTRYTYSPSLARKDMIRQSIIYTLRFLLLLCDLCIILGVLAFGQYLDSPEGTDIFSRIFISIFGA